MEGTVGTFFAGLFKSSLLCITITNFLQQIDLLQQCFAKNILPLLQLLFCWRFRVNLSCFCGCCFCFVSCCSPRVWFVAENRADWTKIHVQFHSAELVRHAINCFLFKQNWKLVTFQGNKVCCLLFNITCSNNIIFQ